LWNQKAVKYGPDYIEVAIGSKVSTRDATRPDPEVRDPMM